MNQYKPDFVSPPGETIIDCMMAQVVVFEDLASQLGLDLMEMARLLSGLDPITEQIAEGLHFAFRVPAEFWMNRQKNFEEGKPPAP